MIKDLVEAEEVIEMHTKWDLELRAMYNYYVEQHHYDMRELGWEKVLYYPEIKLMCKDWHIYPVFMKVEEVTKTFEECIKLKKKQDKNLIKFGLTYEDFLFFLMKLSMKAQYRLALFSKQYAAWEAEEED